MIQYRVPLYRDPMIDLIRIDNYPDDATDHDVYKLEEHLKSKIAKSTDLTVRRFNEMLVIYVGSCKK